jgi:two-component system OmpR family sensor kinase
MTARGGIFGAGRLQARWPSPPIAVQVMALLLAGLVVAQTVTLALTVLLPPAPAMHHTLADIAAGLRGALPDSDADRPLVRTVETQPPSLQSPGWVASEPASADLARLLNAPREDVRLLFYAPPPFAGAESRRPGRPPLALLFTTYAEAQTLPPGPGPGGVGGLRGGMGQWAGGVQRQGFPAGAAMRAAGGQRVFRSDAAGSPAASTAASGPSATRRPPPQAGRSADPLFAAPFRSRTMTLPDSLRGSPTPSSPPLDPVADAAAREPTLKAPPPPQPLARDRRRSPSRSRPRPTSPCPRPSARRRQSRRPKPRAAAPCPRP